MKIAVRKGELEDGSDPQALAEFFSGQALALAVMARSGAKKRAPDHLIDIAMSALPVRRE